MSKPWQVTVSLRLLPEERAALERIAQVEDRTISQVARRLIRRQLAQQGKAK
jgi:predicted transcriptional regulator